jgi:putative tricarboxylic transport membrane protein
MTTLAAKQSFAAILSSLIGLVMAITAPLTAQAVWEPTQQVELIVPAGTGGGADKMARLIQKIVNDNKLMPQPLVVINKSGNQGAEGFLDIKKSPRNPHKLIVTLSNLFTTPIVTGADFNWHDMTPVAMLALDEGARRYPLPDGI